VQSGRCAPFPLSHRSEMMKGERRMGPLMQCLNPFPVRPGQGAPFLRHRPPFFRPPPSPPSLPPVSREFPSPSFPVMTNTNSPEVAVAGSLSRSSLPRPTLIPP